MAGGRVLDQGLCWPVAVQSPYSRRPGAALPVSLSLKFTLGLQNPAKSRKITQNTAKSRKIPQRQNPVGGGCQADKSRAGLEILLLAPPGSSWLLLAPPGSSRPLLAPPGSSRLLLAPPGSSWLLPAPPGSSWLLLAPPGSSWLLLAPPGSSWLLQAPPGSSWLLLAPPGSSRLLLAPPGSSRLLLQTLSLSLSGRGGATRGEVVWIVLRVFFVSRVASPCCLRLCR